MTIPIAPSPSTLSPPFQRDVNLLSDKKTVAPVKPQVNLDEVDPEVLKSAQGMEAMFVDLMLQSMRKTVPKNDLGLDSQATEIYQGMYDTEVADRAAKHGGLGIAEQVVAYLERAGYNVKRAKESPGGKQ